MPAPISTAAPPITSLIVLLRLSSTSGRVFWPPLSRRRAACRFGSCHYRYQSAQAAITPMARATSQNEVCAWSPSAATPIAATSATAATEADTVRRLIRRLSRSSAASALAEGVHNRTPQLLEKCLGQARRVYQIRAGSFYPRSLLFASTNFIDSVGVASAILGRRSTRRIVAPTDKSCPQALAPSMEVSTVLVASLPVRSAS